MSIRLREGRRAWNGVPASGWTGYRSYCVLALACLSSCRPADPSPAPAAPESKPRSTVHVLRDGRIIFLRGVSESVLLGVLRAPGAAAASKPALHWKIGRAEFRDEGALATALRREFESRHEDDPDRPGSKIPVGIMFDIDDRVEASEVEPTIELARKIGFERLSYPGKVPVPRNRDSNGALSVQDDIDHIRKQLHAREGSASRPSSRVR